MSFFFLYIQWNAKVRLHSKEPVVQWTITEFVHAVSILISVRDLATLIPEREMGSWLKTHHQYHYHYYYHYYHRHRLRRSRYHVAGVFVIFLTIFPCLLSFYLSIDIIDTLLASWPLVLVTSGLGGQDDHWGVRTGQSVELNSPVPITKHRTILRGKICSEGAYQTAVWCARCVGGCLVACHLSFSAFTAG